MKEQASSYRVYVNLYLSHDLACEYWVCAQRNVICLPVISTSWTTNVTCIKQRQANYLSLPQRIYVQPDKQQQHSDGEHLTAQLPPTHLYWDHTSQLKPNTRPCSLDHLQWIKRCWDLVKQIIVSVFVSDRSSRGNMWLSNTVLIVANINNSR